MRGYSGRGGVARPAKFPQISVLVWPSLPEQADQVIASLWCAKSEAGFILGIDGGQGASLRLGDGAGGSEILCLGLPMLARHWYRLEAWFDAPSGRAG